MQGRVEQAHGYRQSLHGGKNTFEVGALQGKELIQRFAAAGFIVSQYHFAHGQNLVAFKEHVFRAAEADTFGAKFAGHAGVVRCVGIGAHKQAGIFIGQFHHFAEVAAQFGQHGVYLTFIYGAGRAVQRYPVAFLIGLAVYHHGAGFVVDVQASCAGHAAFTHTAGYHSCVRGHSSAGGEDTLRHVHTFQVFGRGFHAHQYHFSVEVFLYGSFCIVGEENYLAGGGAGRGGKTFSHRCGFVERFFLEHGMQ